MHGRAQILPKLGMASYPLALRGCFGYFWPVPARKKSKVNTKLVSAFSEWAKECELENDVFVSRLLASLRSGTDLEYWAQYDATEFLPFPDIKGGAKENSISERLISFRNIMVFVPVAFTWAGISQATAAFSTYSALNPNKVLNFFDFWENGYGVLNKFWTLSNIARIDFFMLALIILASIAIAYLQRSAKILQKNEKERIDQDRLSIALDINEFLYQFERVTPVILNRSITSMLQNLRLTSNSIARLSKSSEKSAANLAKGSALREQLTSISKKIEKFQK